MEELTIPEAAMVLGLSPATLSQWRWQKKGPAFIKRGRQIRYLRDDLQAYLDAKAERVLTEGAK
jgi:excisionase family DNA binding protein